MAKPAGAGSMGRTFPHIVRTTKTFECDLLVRRRNAIGDREEDYPIRTSFRAIGTAKISTGPLTNFEASLDVLRSL